MRYIDLDKVKFIGGNENQIKGYRGCFDDPTGILEVGKEYDVSIIIEGGWSTEVKLRGIKGTFNSVLFTALDGSELNDY